MSLQPDQSKIKKIEESVENWRSLKEARGINKLIQFITYHFRSYYFVQTPLLRIFLRSLNANKRVAPDVSICGAIRSGTTSLSSAVVQHPSVALTLSKETGIFPRMNLVKAQYPSIKQVEKIEEQYGSATVVDCSPILPNLSAIYIAKALNPNMKFVVTLRNPVDRTISHWLWNTMIMEPVIEDDLWSEMPDFEEAMRVEIADAQHGGSGLQVFAGASGSGFVQHSIYYPFVKRLIEEFGRDNIKFISAERFFEDSESVAKEVYEFAGLPDYEPVPISETNPTTPIFVTQTIKDELAEFFRPYNQQLYDLVGEDFGWNKP